ncbi:hypothetical protein ABMA27_002142 [Loxostege sticticalis]|uniref:Tc1-like transposase DDE domain-containing protein n=1 Tax=Loxostege sticticalis TaxID=481309 RepID=A0ABR3HWQ5_LOXSC
MTRRNTVLRRQARKMVYDVHCFLKRETDKLTDSLKQLESVNNEAENILRNYLESGSEDFSPIKKVADMISAGNDLINNSMKELGKIQKTVRKISTQAKSSDLITVFKTPGKKRCKTKPVTNIDNFNQGVIKSIIHNFHNTNNELPTVGKLKKKLEEDINYKGSERSLRRIIKSLGFRWKNTENNRKILIETSNIRYQRIEYLRKIKQYRQEGRPIVYTDESYVDSSHSSQKAWTDGTTKGLKKPISKGQRVVIVHAGSETGFIPNALLTFKAGTKSGDYHDNMNFENYEKWLKSQLMPNLPANSVVVVDNASYHNKLWDRAPTSNAKKAAMQAWLTEKGIEYEKTQLKKPQLYNLIKANKERFKTFSIDRILAEQGHQVLRLPPYHPDLNPIEMAWSDIKQYVGSKNDKWSITKIQEKVLLMGAWDWQKLCKKVQDIEEQYAISDHVVDLVTEEFIIQVNEDSSDDSIDESDEDESASTDDRSSPEPGPTTSKRPCLDTIEGVTPLSDSD